MNDMNLDTFQNKNIDHKFCFSEHDETTCTDNIYIINNGYIKPLAYATVYKYIFSICEKMKIEHLDIDKITKNVYPKLKINNTISEIENQIIMCASEMVIDHYDYP